MSDITISPIPYNSGTMQWDQFSVHYCDMGGKFLHIAAQINPNYVYAWVSTYANLKTGTFSDVPSTMRALLTPSTPVPAPSSASIMRLWKINSTQALFMLNRTLYVLEIQANNDVVMKNATVPNFNQNTTPTIGGSLANYSYGTSGIGFALQGWYIRDNVLWFANRSANTTGNTVVTIQKVSYDTVADTLAVSTLTTATIATGTPRNWFFHPILQTIPGSTKRLFTLRGRDASIYGGNQFAVATPVYATLIDTVNDAVTATSVLTGMNAGVLALAPLSETLMLGLSNTRTFFTWTGGSWVSTSAYFGANATGSPSIFQVEALDANYLMIMTANSTDIINVQFNSRICRYIDPTFGQTSSATITGDGITLAVSNYVFYDQPLVNKNGTDSFVVYGRVNPSSIVPSIKVIYQPGA